MRLLFFLLLFPAIGHSQRYHWFHPVTDPRADGYFQVPLGPEALSGLAEGFADLRLVVYSETDTTELPYLLKTWPDDSVWRPSAFEVMREGERKDQGFITLKILDNPSFNRIRLQIDADAYNLKVALQTSKNRLFWDACAKRQLSGKLQGGQRAGQSVLDFDSLRASFLRIQYEPAETPVAVTELGFYQFRPGKYRRYDVADFTEQTETSNNTTIAFFDLGMRLPLSRLRLRLGGSRDFYRQATLFVATDTAHTEWKSVKRFVLSSLAEPVIEFEPVWGRHWKVVVSHEDNLPVRISRVEPFAPAYSLVADLRRGAKYALRYGNPRARAPRYDLSALQGSITWDQLPELRLRERMYTGPQVVSPSFSVEEPGSPISDLRQLLTPTGDNSPKAYGLWAAGGALALLVLFFIFRKKKKTSRP